MAEAVAPRGSKLPIAAASRVIAKSRPKVRIIHLLAPEIIKTEPANFRDLVQRLTVKLVPEAPTLLREAREERSQFWSQDRVGWGVIKQEMDEDDDASVWMASTGCKYTRDARNEFYGFADGFLEISQEADKVIASYVDLLGELPVSS